MKSPLKLYEKIIERLYLKTKTGILSTLNQIPLSRPRFYKPTADGQTLLNWGEILKRSNSTDGYAGYDASQVKRTLLSLVSTSEHKEERFDFSKIQSLSSSKGFGQSFINTINGSWFDDIASWGASMYFNDKMAAATSEDWEKNISHVESNAFQKGKPITVHYLSWIDRYYAPQSGGSHHSALVAYQIKHQNRRYEREAIVIKHSLDTFLLNMLQETHYAFVTGAKLDDKRNSPLALTIHQHICEGFFELGIPNSVNQTSLIVIPKDGLLVPNDVFEEWLECKIKNRQAIHFIDLLENHGDYCTEPYIHEIDTITLGDPMGKINT